MSARTQPLHFYTTAEIEGATRTRRLASAGEFPAGAAVWSDGASRRDFVRLVGATVIAAAGAECGGPRGEIVPYAVQPPEVVPGVPLHYATAMELDGYATGLVIESREGRPVKAEGNPAHPASLGAAGVFAQASILQLYDPDRARYITRRGDDSTWAAFSRAFTASELQRLAGPAGDGLFFLLEPTASPVLIEMIGRVRQRYPAASFHFFTPLSPSSVTKGTELACGRPVQPIYDLSNADVVLSADADLFGSGPFSLRYARQFADGRRVRSASDSMNRLYAIDGVMTTTGVAADHRLAVRPDGIVRMLATLVRELRGTASGRREREDAADAALAGLATSDHRDWIRLVAADLQAHAGRSLVAIGDRQPPAAHALGCYANELLRAFGATVRFIQPARAAAAASGGDLGSLVKALRAGAVKVLVIAGGNPSYTAPASIGFGDLVRRVPLSAYAGEYAGITASDTQWHVPLAHFLESWGDARALDGTASIVQPLIAPLFGGRSVIDLLAFFAADGRASNEIVRQFWMDDSRLGADAETWRATLRRGVVTGSEAAPIRSRADWRRLPDALAAATSPSHERLQLVLDADASVHDGRFGNNAWLQELPDPITKLTWQNAARLSPSTAAGLGVSNGSLVDLTSGTRQVRAPVVIVPGMTDGLVALSFGYGQTHGGRTTTGAGVNAYALWAEIDRYWQPASIAPATFLGLPLSEPLAVSQLTLTQENRPVLLAATLAELAANPALVEPHRGPLAKLYGSEFSGRQWGMAIDLSVCTGCSACVVACQAENNVPVVGKGGVLERREMHWLRVDRYATSSGSLHVQPMLCQHCEDAPCEYVCPVNATVHSPDGLNEMIYNRCVGTRFCSNNCPYKVRRFNYLNYTSRKSETEKMAMNPDVTVRDRGVMEKCTFCVQRIRRADIAADESGSEDPYGSLQTACQQACPTRAITFGPISDPASEVVRAAGAPHSYQVLHELGTRPRVHYLVRLRNTHPGVPEVTA